MHCIDKGFIIYYHIDSNLSIEKDGGCVAETNILRFRKGDWLAVSLVIMLAVAVLLCFLPGVSDSGGYAQVYLDGQLIKTLPLDQPQTFSVAAEYTNEITVSDGAIAITSSDCPRQDCVHSGSIHRSGRSLVCLPNRVEIRVISDEADVDFVVG